MNKYTYVSWNAVQTAINHGFRINVIIINRYYVGIEWKDQFTKGGK